MAVRSPLRSDTTRQQPEGGGGAAEMRQVDLYQLHLLKLHCRLQSTRVCPGQEEQSVSRCVVRPDPLLTPHQWSKPHPPPHLSMAQTHTHTHTPSTTQWLVVGLPNEL